MLEAAGAASVDDEDIFQIEFLRTKLEGNAQKASICAIPKGTSKII